MTNDCPLIHVLLHNYLFRTQLSYEGLPDQWNVCVCVCVCVCAHTEREEMHCSKHGYHATSFSWHILTLRLNLRPGEF
jgi:hypothetical protein